MGPGPFAGHERHFHHDMGWGGWALWTLLSVAFLVLVIAAIVWLVRGMTGRGFVGGPQASPRRGPAAPAVSPPEQILAERFAHGEIDEAEYRSRLAVLRGGSAGPAAPAEPPAAQPPPTQPPAAPPQA